MKFKRSKTVNAEIWGIKPLRTKTEFKKLVLLGRQDKMKLNLLKQIQKKAINAGYSVHTFSDSGIVASMGLFADSRNDFREDFDNSEFSGSLFIYDNSIKGRNLMSLKRKVNKMNARVIYIADSEEQANSESFLVDATVIEFTNNRKIKLTNNGITKNISTFSIGGVSAKQVFVAIIVLGIGFGLGGVYNMRNVALIGSGDYSVTAQGAIDSGMLYSTPDGVAIGIMNSMKSEVAEKDITKAVKDIESKPNVGVLSLQPAYYKTSQGLRAIVDFGLTAKVEVDKAIKSTKLKDTSWKAYTNRTVSYVVINTQAYESEDKEKAEETTVKKALESGDLTSLSSDENISAVSNVSTTSAQVTQLPLYSDTSSMAKIKSAKKDSLVEITAGDYKVFFKAESEEKGKKSDKEYANYLKRLASTQVGNALASEVGKNKKIDSSSRATIENDIKTALNQYGAKG